MLSASDSGWERVESSEFGVYYVNHTTRHAQYEHPCAPRYSAMLCGSSGSMGGVGGTGSVHGMHSGMPSGGPSSGPIGVGCHSGVIAGFQPGGFQMQGGEQSLPPVPRHTEFHGPTHSVLVPANPYLYEEIPYWLQFYFKAAQEHDHKLRWELFRLPELDCYDNVLKRLFKQELESVVLNYEVSLLSWLLL